MVCSEVKVWVGAAAEATKVPMGKSPWSSGSTVVNEEAVASRLLEEGED